jgi:hypothetical protein
MKYVDNLLECKPEEIQLVNNDTKIIAIVHTPKALNEFDRVRIVWEDGSTNTYSVDGQWSPNGCQYFTYRSKKVKRLKPLHVILSEHQYQYHHMRLWISVRDDDGALSYKDYRADVLWENRGTLGKKFVEGIYPASFFEEVEE